VERFKSIYRVAGAAVPILYCGYLLYYFFDVGGSIDGVRDVGLGPTVIGLGAVALLFSIPFLLKVVRLFKNPPSPRSGGGMPGTDGDDDDDGGAAADAIIARYMARQAAEAASAAPAPAPKMSGPAKPSFGKKR
jgi:hypothetical protein